MIKEKKNIVIGTGVSLLIGSIVYLVARRYYDNKRNNDPETGSWSFESLLRKYLREIQPKQILEWGPGVSTVIMNKEMPNALIHTIEHSPIWASRWRAKLPASVQIIEIPLGDSYSRAPLSWGIQYDLIFVDGERSTRNKCLAIALQLLSDRGVVILHDSDWKEYTSGKSLFRVIEESRRTAVMVKCSEVNGFE